MSTKRKILIIGALIVTAIVIFGDSGTPSTPNSGAAPTNNQKKGSSGDWFADLFKFGNTVSGAESKPNYLRI